MSAAEKPFAMGGKQLTEEYNFLLAVKLKISKLFCVIKRAFYFGLLRPLLVGIKTMLYSNILLPTHLNL